MLDVAHLRKVYRDFDGMMELTKEADSLLNHYYPDFEKLVECIANDEEWIYDTCAQIGLERTERSFGAMETALEWGLTWATYALGPALVREHLQEATRKPWLAALTVAGADPHMFMSGRGRSSLNQWLGELVATYALNRRNDMEDQLEEPLSEEFVYIVVQGFIEENVPDQLMGERVHRHACRYVDMMFNNPEVAQAAALDETMH
ncbi:hypothetical protein [Stenotrophomonas sp. GD03657]|uniref:hypothetical protein n=1 Tax=Stenotrophomonas sp. GD03657 TaxID=2975363 RepID=UPI002446FB6F|nr:hypothetical protein [Stenotrophomonas sp. GD03657]MDH2154343.1 hypothetical protein [Stenotrophomonas sp. GD03657]